MTPINTMMAGNDPTLSGFDMDFSKLIFSRVRAPLMDVLSSHALSTHTLPPL